MSDLPITSSSDEGMLPIGASALNTMGVGSSVLQHFEHSNTMKIRNRIMFDFYSGLPHIHVEHLLAQICCFQSIIAEPRPPTVTDT